MARGAALLDEKMPGWERSVDEENLGEKPLLVQLFGFRSSGGLSALLSDRPERREMVRGAVDEKGRQMWRTREPILIAPLYGFLTEHARNEPSLRHIWRREIEKRKAVHD